MTLMHVAEKPTPNRSLKRSANGRPPGLKDLPLRRRREWLAQAGRERQATRPGLAVRGTFSPARAWRPSVAARLARMLGYRLKSMTEAHVE